MAAEYRHAQDLTAGISADGYFMARKNKNKGSNMKKSITKAAVLLAAITVPFGLISCSKNTSEVKTVYVGVGYESDFSYLNEKGELAGYEIDMLKAIDEALPQYEFKYETSDLKGILLGLSAGKFDIGLKQDESNEERRKNYLFSESGYLCYDSYIQVLSTRNDINSLEDLQGKTVLGGSTVGAAMGTKLENLNKDLPDDKKYKVIYAKLTTEELLASLKNGSIDASTSTKALFRKKVQQYGDVVKLVGKEPVRKSDAYVLFNKEQGKLKADFDAVLNDLVASGKLSEISVKALGYDYKDN